MLKNNPYIYYIFIFFAPLFVFLFNQYNEILANSDGQHYLDIALMHYQVFEDKGFLAGLDSLYNLRSQGLRPLIYPVFISFFMLITKGDLFLTTSLVMSSIALIWVIYLYRIFLWSGCNKIVSSLGSILIVIWPGFSYYHYNMFSETAHITVLFMFLYYILESDYLKNRISIYKAGICSALMLCIRPELIFIVPLGLSFYAYCYFKMNRNFLFELKQIVLITSIFFLSLYSSFLVNISPLSDCSHCISNSFRSQNESIILYIIAIMTIIFYLLYGYFINFKKNLNQNNLSILIIIIFTLTLAWYLPFADELFEWFRVGMFNLQDYNNPVADFNKNWAIIWPNWSLLFLYLFISFLAIFYFSKFYKKENFNNLLMNKSSQLLIIGLVMSLVYFILLLTENAGITPLRRTAPAVFVLASGIIAFTGVNMNSTKKFISYLPIVVLSIGVIISSLSAFSSKYSNFVTDKSQYIQRKMNIPWQHTIYAGPSKPSFNFIESLHKYTVNNNLQKSYIKIATFTHWPPDITHGIYTAKRKLRVLENLSMWILHPGSLTLDDLRKQKVTHLMIDTFPEYSDQEVEKKIGFHFYPGWKIIKELRRKNFQGMTYMDSIEINKRNYLIFKL